MCLRGCRIILPSGWTNSFLGTGSARCQKNRGVLAADQAMAALSTCLSAVLTARFPVGFPRFAGAGQALHLAYFLPAATWLIADLQLSLRSARVDLMQANFAVRRRASAQRCFRSSVHAFAAAAVAANKS